MQWLHEVYEARCSKMYSNKVILAYIFPLLIFFLVVFPSFAIQIPSNEGICEQDKATVQSCEADSNNFIIKPSLPDIKKNNETKKEAKKVLIYFFEGTGCPFCEKEKVFLNELMSKHKNLDIRQYEVWHNRENALLMAKMLNAYGLQPQGVPVTFIGEKVFIGFSEQIKADIKKAIERCSDIECPDPYEKTKSPIVKEKITEAPKTPDATLEDRANRNEQTVLEVPIIGNLEVSNMSLPILTITIAGLDSFNPCAFFVLFALLGLLAHAGSRKRIFLIGGIFVFFSGFIYFVFMAAWLNLFIFMGNVSGITTSAGIISLIISLINIKDFFAFKKGISLTIPESAKPGLFDKMRRLMRSTSTVSILLGTIVLAVTANSYELLCTAGFPLVYTRILTLNDLSTSIYYMYLILYNLVYVIPLLIIVILFSATYGKKKLTERQGRLLKLMSGVMMFELGALLLFKPEFLNNVAISASLLGIALLITGLAAYFTRDRKDKRFI